MSRRHLICGVDGSEPARRAAATALRLADRLGDRLVLVHVIPPRPPMSLATVPVGAHPVRRGVRSAVVGSVSAGLTRLAPCPVVTVPPDAQNAARRGHATSGKPNAS
jgi:nucleotide-binding universal stress UspA family protein